MIKSFFVEGLGTSNNKFNGMHKAVVGKYKTAAENRVKRALAGKNFGACSSPVFISFFSVVGGNEEECFEGVKIKGQVRKKYTASKNGYDCDNVTIYTKMLQDQFRYNSIIKDDNAAFLKGVYFPTYHKDRDLTSGFIVVIEDIEDSNIPDLKKHFKEFEKILKEQKEKHKWRLILTTQKN